MTPSESTSSHAPCPATMPLPVRAPPSPLPSNPFKRPKLDPPPSAPSSLSPPSYPSPTVVNPLSHALAELTSHPVSPSPPGVSPTCMADLPNDVLYRIASYFAKDAQRGTPYYAPHLAPDLLTLAECSRALRTAAAVHLKDDTVIATFLSDDEAAAPVQDFGDEDRRHPLSSYTKKCILDWYRASRNTLHSCRLAAMLAHTPTLRLRALQVLTRGESLLPLRELDLLGLSPLPRQQDLLETLYSLLRKCRTTLVVLKLDPVPALARVVTRAALTHITKLHLEITLSSAFGPQLELFLRSMHGDYLHNQGDWSMLSLLTVSSYEPLRHYRLPKDLPALIPNVSSLDYIEAAVNYSQVYLPAVLDIAAGLPKLEHISLTNVRLSELNLRRVLSLRDGNVGVALKTCEALHLGPVLREHGAAKLVSLELGTVLDGPQLAIVGELCEGIESAKLCVGCNALKQLQDAMANWRRLESMKLTVTGDRDSPSTRRLVERNVAAALECAGPKFRQLVVHGVKFCVPVALRLTKKLGKRLEYLVMALWPGTAGHMRCLITMIQLIRNTCPSLRVLCFGLYLVYDNWAEQMWDLFLEEVACIGRKLQGLDTYWLKRNGDMLMKLKRPEGFVDYPVHGIFDEGG